VLYEHARIIIVLSTPPLWPDELLRNTCSPVWWPSASATQVAEHPRLWSAVNTLSRFCYTKSTLFKFILRFTISLSPTYKKLKAIKNQLIIRYQFGYFWGVTPFSCRTVWTSVPNKLPHSVISSQQQWRLNCYGFSCIGQAVTEDAKPKRWIRWAMVHQKIWRSRHASGLFNQYNVC